ncbi:MAG TPA: pyridoxal-phosphate dependent enzyme, partial [Chitinophagaceae bacterium]|nr:pyridoxal-phosphate dependent enzyme [Chitinophagaceae bacterium]
MDQNLINTSSLVSENSEMPFRFQEAALRLKGIVNRTPLQFNHNLSRKYGCNIFLKREDLQIVRSYKLRGAYNMMSKLSREQLEKGVVCASAGNH